MRKGFANSWGFRAKAMLIGLAYFNLENRLQLVAYISD